MAGVIIGILSMGVQSMSQARDVEARVGERASAFWEAMRISDYETAARFLHPSYRKVFSHEIPKSRVIAWKLEKVVCNEDLTECDTALLVTKPFPVMADTVEWPLRNQWVLHENEWYLKLPWKEGENPFLHLFADRDSVNRTVTAGETGKDQGAAVPSDGREPREMRVVSDAGNPSSVRFGQRGVFRYNFTNRGAAPLRILSVHSDCHCTGVPREYPEVGPGETGTFEVTLDTFGLPLGRTEKSLLVQFSDLPDPVAVGLGVEIRPNFSLTPPVADFGAIPTGRESTLNVALVNRSGRTVSIVTVQKFDPRLTVELDRHTFAPDERINLSLRYSPASAGGIEDNLQLHLDLEAEPIVNIPVRGRVSVANTAPHE